MAGASLKVQGLGGQRKDARHTGLITGVHWSGTPRAGRGCLLPSPTAPLAGNTPRPEGDLQSADLIPVSHTLTSNSTLEKHPSDRLPEIGAGMDGARWENGERRL